MERTSASASGNFKIQTATLETKTHYHNIIQLIESVDVVEGMLDGLAHGEIRIKDTVGLIDSIGSEIQSAMVNVSWSTDSSSDASGNSNRSLKNNAGVVNSKSFGITSISYITDDHVTTKTVKLALESKPSIANEFKRVSKSYPAAQGISPIVMDLLTTLSVPESKMLIEKTMTCSGSQDSIIIPNLTPLEAIEHLTVMGVSASDAKLSSAARSTMYFFEDSQAINLVSLGTLINKDVVANLKWDSAPTISDPDRALSFQRSELFDTPRSARSGSFGSTYYEHSITDKSMRTVRSGTAKPKGMLNEDVAWDDDRASDYPTTFTKYQVTDGPYTQQSIGEDSFVLRRTTRSRMLDQKALLTAPGNSAVTAGSVIHLSVPNAFGDASTNDSGKWLVSRVVHHISRSKYTMDLEVVRDSSPKGGML